MILATKLQLHYAETSWAKTVRQDKISLATKHLVHHEIYAYEKKRLKNKPLIRF